MKRMIAILLCCAMPFFFAACQPEETVTPSGGESGGAAETETADRYLSLHIEEVYESQWGENGPSVDFYLSGGYLGLEHPADTPELQKGLEAYNEELRKQYASQKSELQGIEPLAEEEVTDGEECEEVGEEDPSYYETRLLVQRADRSVLAVLQMTDGYFTGGAHPTRSFGSANFDVKTGKRLTLSDVVKDADALYAALSEKLESRYSEDLFEDWRETLGQMLKEDAVTFVLGNQGLQFTFGPYELAPYAAGTLSVQLPYGDADSLIREEYTRREAAYAVAIPGGTPVLAELDGDGEAEELSVFFEADEYDAYVALSVMADEKEAKETREVFFYDGDAYFLHTEAGDYVYVDTASDNDYHTLYVFEVTGGTPRFSDAFDGGIPGRYGEAEDRYIQTLLTDPSAFPLGRKIDLLSSYYGSKTYHTGAQGIPESDAEFFAVDSYFTLKTAEEFSLPVLSGELEPTGETRVLPVGTGLTVVQSDGKSLVDLRDGEGNFYRAEVLVGNGDIWQSVDGKSIEDLFEELYFAG